MIYGKRRTETVNNRFLLIEQRLTKKYSQTPQPEFEANQIPNDNALISSSASLSSGQSLCVVRAFACDDGAPINLEYNSRIFREIVEIPPARQSISSSLNSEHLPHHFEAFIDSSPPTVSSVLLPGNKLSQLPQNKVQNQPLGNEAAINQNPECNTQPNSTALDWSMLENAAQQSLPPEEDTFVADLQSLLTEARRRVETGQETPAISHTETGQSSADSSQPPAPTAASPAAQEQIAGKDASNRHALFNQLGQQMQRAVTFDMGTVPVDKTFAAIEASIDAEQRVQSKRQTIPRAKPLKPIETVEDMALMTVSSSSKEAYMLSGDIPLDPGTGGRSIPVSTLESGDLIVSTTKEVPSWLIRFGTDAPVSHSMLYVGYGQVVEAIAEGVVLRTVEEAIADSYLAVAFRHPMLNSEQAQRIRDYAGQQISKPYNYTGILKQTGFQLSKKAFCSEKTGEEYESCIRWVGRINLGTATNDRFFCSELILKSYEAVGIPLTTTPPNYSTPGDLSLLQQSGMLAYVGHLKYES
jgi:uncharacterized protein YycO